MHRLSRTVIFIVLSAGLNLYACKPTSPGDKLPQVTQVIVPSPEASPVFTPLPVEPSPSIPPVASLTPTIQPTSSPTPLAVSSRPGSLFLVLFDGAGARSIDDLMAQGWLPHFSAVSERGLQAEYAVSVDPSLTAPASNSISTGSNPGRTGIVSNYYHVSDDSFYWYRSGFAEGVDQAEPVWVTAARAGLKSATLFFAGGDPDLPGQIADYTIGYGTQDAYSGQERISLNPAGDWQAQPVSFSPLLEGSFTVEFGGSDLSETKTRVFLLVIDSTDDGKQDYDRVIVNTSPAVTVDSLTLKVGDWGSLVLSNELVSGADFLLQDLQPKSLTLFHTASNHNVAAPYDLLADLNQNFGFFPAEPDHYALARGWITEEDYLHMLARNTHWMAEVTSWVFNTLHPDLLFTWQGGFDYAGHAFILNDTRQSGYTPERADQYAGYYRKAAEISDQALEIMLDAINLQDTTLFLVSDHGMAAQHTTVYLNTILERAGLLVLDPNHYVNVEASRAIAFASGGSANIYINLRGRERKGIVEEKDYTLIQQQILDTLGNLTDEDGKPVFQRVIPHDQLDVLGLNHTNSGDVFLQANPGYELDDWRGNASIFAPAQYYGGHGYDCNQEDMLAFFIAAGPHISLHEGKIPPVHIIDYAPTIAALFGFDPARWVDGVSIPAVVH